MVTPRLRFTSRVQAQSHSRAANPAASHWRDSWAGVKKYAVVPSWRRHRLGARRCAGGILHVVDSAMSGALGSAP